MTSTWIRGQGYDNGSNMKGIESGVKARIKRTNPRALVVLCSSHSLNLVVNDMAKSSLETTIVFNTVQKIIVIFHFKIKVVNSFEECKRYYSNTMFAPTQNSCFHRQKRFSRENLCFHPYKICQTKTQFLLKTL